MSDPTPKTRPVTRLLLIGVCVVLFAALAIYSAVKVRYHFDDKSNSEITVTELSLSHAVTRGDDGNLELKPGNVSNTGARKPCPT